MNSQDSTGAAQGAPVQDSPRRGLGQGAAPLGRFLPLDAILARYMLRLSVCPSVHHKPVLYRNDRTNRAGFCHGCFLLSIPRCIIGNFG